MNRIYITAEGDRIHESFVRCAYLYPTTEVVDTSVSPYRMPRFPVIEFYAGSTSLCIAVEESDDPQRHQRTTPRFLRRHLHQRHENRLTPRRPRRTAPPA